MALTETKVKIRNEVGLHLRPAQQLVYDTRK
ncbi:MAG: HPr family phosphocarrier protein, partial [Lachnospiraceae bacterium]|nr:HPr family phosphocarrier protein [Lachnospiraceae bacterium]